MSTEAVRRWVRDGRMEAVVLPSGRLRFRAVDAHHHGSWNRGTGGVMTVLLAATLVYLATVLTVAHICGINTRLGATTVSLPRPDFPVVGRARGTNVVGGR